MQARGIVVPRPIQRLLVANRGEIAARILSSARELGIETFAVYTENDVAHIHNAAHAVRLKSPASYMSVDEMLHIVQEHRIDALHPGYGFLSESEDLAARMAEIDVMVVGPGAENLRRTGDKLQARLLAQECDVPVLPAFTTPTGSVDAVRKFAEENGLPIMVKAVDGGGGRGIRLVRRLEDLTSLVTRAVEESPSRQVFAERAAVDGFRHVEVQIVGDGKGNVVHLWERECSIQRRYQKIVELAPSTVQDRSVIAPVIEAAVRIARKINYASLGTFEFLLNPNTKKFFFLEINPRLQVEHTITESICSTDLVKAQLRLAQGESFETAGLASLPQDPLKPPSQYAIQLRVTAEDPEKGYSLSIGKIQSFSFPSGNGVRIDTAMSSAAPAIVTSDYDSLIAKLIVTTSTWSDAVMKARRALEDLIITGVRTNVALLRTIAAHQDFNSGLCDTQWLELKHDELLSQSRHFAAPKDPFHGLVKHSPNTTNTSSVSSSSSTLFRRDDAWTIELMPQGKNSQSPSSQPQALNPRHHLQLTKVLRNDFPDTLAAEILYTTPGAKPIAYAIDIKSTSASASALSSQHRQGSRSDPTHVIMPISGKLVEVLVNVGDVIKKDDAVCVIKQMKMEIEVRSHRAGVVSWVTEAEDDEDVAEGMLAAVVEDVKVEAKL